MDEILQLFVVFLKIGLFSIGGGYAVIPLIQEQVVIQSGWISQQMFTDIITISQMTPGPLAVNTSTFVGIQIAGIPGAIAATFGCISSGIVLSLVLYHFFNRHRKSDYVIQVLNGLKASSLGLIMSASVTIIGLSVLGTVEEGAVPSVDWIAAGIFFISFLLLRKKNMHPVLLMAGAGVAGGLIYGLL